MAEPHMKTAGVNQYIRKPEDAATTAITPSAEVATEFKQLKMKRQYRYVLFKIVGSDIVPDATGERSKTFADFIKALPDSECRYAVYEHEFSTSDGRKASKLFLVTYIPENSNPGNKMAYTHAKKTMRGVCDGCFDVAAVEKKDIEAGMGLTNTNDSDSDSDFSDN